MAQSAYRLTLHKLDQIYAGPLTSIDQISGGIRSPTFSFRVRCSAVQLHIYSEPVNGNYVNVCVYLVADLRRVLHTVSNVFSAQAKW